MSANTAVALADGAVDDETRQSWQGHLAECGVCRQMLAALLETMGGEGAPPPPVAVEHASGDRVSRYELVERLGVGGFGVVFRARDPELGRDVALKLWRFSGADPVLAESARERLLGEARALAQLAHPNVMAVFDSGRDGDEVFLAGELIAGKSFAARIAEGLSVAEAVDVALQAARGLAAAHAAGIVHRDVKPDNILCGDDGRVRVVDFGLARSAARPDDARKSDVIEVPRLRETITMTGSVVGTPAYMAPEQFRGEPANAATDQFGLCASLFEALSGIRPVPGDSFEELRDAAIAGERRPISSKVPAWLARLLERGLDPDPARRFPSMQALIDELERDRGRAWRRAGWAASALGVGAAVALFTWRADAGVSCDGAEARLAGVWDDERREVVRARFEDVARGKLGGEAFARVAAALDEYSAEWVAMHQSSCEATHVRGEQSAELLDRRTACLERRRRELDSLVDLFAEADAALVERAPRAITELAPLSQCADIEGLTVLAPRPGDPESRRALDELDTELATIEALRMAGKYPEATERAAAAAERAAEIGYAPITAEAAFELGNLHSYQNQGEEAGRWLEDAHHQAIAARAWRVAARAAVEMVLVHGRMTHDHERAREWGRHAEAALAAAGGDEQLRSNLDNNLGEAALDAGDYDAALGYHRRALERRLDLHGESDRSVAQTLNNLGVAEQGRGDYAAAAEHFARAHAIFAETLGPHHPYVGQTAQNLGGLRQALGDPAAAETLFRQAHTIAVDSQGETSAAALDARFNVGVALDEQGRADEARAIFEEVLAARREHFPSDLEGIARVVNSLGVVAERAGDLERARPHFEEALALRRQIHGDDHPDALFVALNLALVAGRQGDGARAMELLSEVVAGFEKAYGAEHPFLGVALTARARQALGVTVTASGQKHRGDAAAALADLERALAIYDAADEVDPEWRADAIYHRGVALWERGARGAGRAAVRDALARYRELGARGEGAATEAAAWLEAHE